MKNSISKITGEFVLSEIEIKEAEAGKKRALVATLVREGPGNQYHGNYYLKEFLTAVSKVIPESPKQYFNHAADIDYPNRDIRDWASSIVETHVDVAADGKARLRAKIEIYDDWLWGRAQQAPDQLALSIEGKGVGDKQVIEGKEYNAIRDINVFNAVNWVDYPGNAGMGVQVIEKNRRNQREEEVPMLKELIEKFQAMSAEDKAAFLEANPELKGTVTPSLTVDASAVSKAVEEKLAGFKKDLDAAVKAANDKAVILESEKAALTNKVEALSLREAERNKQALVDKLLGESKLKAEHKTVTFHSTLLAVKEHEVGGVKVTEEAQMKTLIEDREKICIAEAASPDAPNGTGKQVSEHERRRAFALNILGEDIGTAEEVEKREAAILGK